MIMIRWLISTLSHLLYNFYSTLRNIFTIWLHNQKLSTQKILDGFEQGKEVRGWGGFKTGARPSSKCPASAIYHILPWQEGLTYNNYATILFFMKSMWGYISHIFYTSNPLLYIIYQEEQCYDESTKSFSSTQRTGESMRVYRLL